LVVVVVVVSSSSSSGNLSTLDGTMAISAVEFSKSSSLEELKKTNSQFATLFFNFFMNLPAQGNTKSRPFPQVPISFVD